MAIEFPKAITVPANSTPSMFNREMVDGGFIGNILTRGGGGELVGTLAGGAIGGMFGKERMERKYREGRVVHEPGSAAGSIVPGLVVGGLLGALFGAALMTGVGIAIAAGIGLLLGGLVGNSNHQSDVQDYEAAKSYYVEHGGHYQGRDREEQRANAVTPEEYQRLQQRLAAAENTRHADRYNAESPELRTR